MDYVPSTALHHHVSRLDRHELRDRLHAVRALSAVRGLRFLDDRSRPHTIELALLPWVLTPAQLRFFGGLAWQMADALMRLSVLYARHPAIRQVLPFDPVQASWVRLAAHPRSRPFAVMGRFDSTTTFDHAAWRCNVQLLEPNAVGVGGVHYAPTACSIVLDVLGDLLTDAFPALKLAPTPDPRQLLVEELARVAGRLGRRLRRLALLENAEFTTGTDEFGQLARHLSGRGLQALVVDPRDLRLSRGRLMAKNQEIDLIYRDCELNEFIDMEARGSRLTALRKAIHEGRLISGLLWEFDQKSSWEVFTDPVWSRAFTPGQRRVFRAYLPWTRLVRETSVCDPAQRRTDLLPYIRRHKDRLVLKPNPLYGGQGVVIGKRVSQAVWERTLSHALQGSTRYVVQRLAPIGTARFPVLEDGGVRVVERCVVAGFFFNSSSTVGLVGRFSADPVVNVSRGGGLLSALMVR